jgi:hypothetical protein
MSTLINPGEPLIGAAAAREPASVNPSNPHNDGSPCGCGFQGLGLNGFHYAGVPGCRYGLSRPTVADVEPIAAAMTAAPPSIREPADADDRGPARAWGSWQAPPRRRRNIGREARIATGSGHKLHLKIDLDDAGQPCAIKAEVHKEGSVFRGMLDTICALASQALQHGASIHEVAERMIGVRFEPDGAVEGHAAVKECLSIVDLLGRMIEAEFPRAGARRAGGGE